MSEEMKHKIGEWYANEYAILEHTGADASDVHAVAVVFDPKDSPVVAASKDMLAALKALSYQLHCMNWSGKLIDNCDAAIAKAKEDK